MDSNALVMTPQDIYEMYHGVTLNIIAEDTLVPDYGMVTLFGLELKSPANNTRTIGKITPNYSEIAQLMDIITEHNVSPVHIGDVVYDFIG